MNYKMIKYILGWVLNIEAACMLLPLICSIIYKDECIGVFSLCIIICLAAGTLLVLFQPENKAVYAKEGFVIVALSWITISLFGALPFYLSGQINSYIDALFETVSGFTTTGASILKDVETLAPSLAFWRSFTHWIGGMGVLVFLVAVLPLAGGNNIHLIKAESPGPNVSKLVPKVKSTAKILYLIYVMLTVLQIVLLLFGKMPVFDALTTTFATVGTGGFGIKNSSMTDYSPYIQNVVTAFMFLSGIDFSLYYLLLLKRFKDIWHSDEWKVYFGTVFLAVVLICFNSSHLFGKISDCIRHSAFQVSSIMTTTGFATCDFDTWPQFSKTILLLLMFIGACAGSTGGGIKVSRIMILFKSIGKEIKIAAHPKSTHKIMMNGRLIEHETVRGINVFMVSYLVIFMSSLLLISLDNQSFATNFTAVAATINNIGPGLDAVGPTQNFSLFSPLSKLILMFDMLVGRLEIFPMLLLFSPYTWKK